MSQTSVNPIKVLETLGGRVIISADEKIYDDVMEDLEMYANKGSLEKELATSVQSGRGFIV